MEQEEIAASANREQLREELIRRSEESFRAVNDPVYIDRIRYRLRSRITTAAVLCAFVFAAVAAALLYWNNYNYTTYSVDSVLKQNALGNTALYTFGSGNLLLGSDSVSYQAEGEQKWTSPLKTGTFSAVTEGEYFAIFDKNGYQVMIGDVNGLISTVKVSRRILGADISAAGVIAIYTESRDAAYISYFDRSGSRLPVEIKTVMEVSGYPMNIAVSPDGQKLAVVYYSIMNGIGGSRLVLYDFQSGRASSSYVVYTKEDYADRDVLLMDCDFPDDRHLVAVGDREATFLTYDKPDECTEKTVEFDRQVLSIAFEKNGFMTIQGGGEDNTSCVIYDETGRVKSSFSVSPEYDGFTVGEQRILFLNREKVTIYNFSGRKRYEGALVSSPGAAAASGKNSFLINTGTELELITYK